MKVYFVEMGCRKGRMQKDLADTVGGFQTGFALNRAEAMAGGGLL